MKKVFFFDVPSYYFTILALFFVLCVSGNVYAQDSCRLKFIDIRSNYEGYLFYTEDPLTGFTVNYIVAAEDQDAAFQKMLKKQSFVKGIQAGEKNGDTLQLVLSLKKHPDASQMRAVLEKCGLKFFSINGQRMWVSSLLTLSEARTEAVAMDLKTVPYSAATNNPELPEYYEYKLYSLKTKLNYMLNGEYPKHLYNGFVTQFKDMIDSHIKDTEDYYNQHSGR